jgi:hypothetical protein
VFKNIIIAVLAIVLCAGAISSRPGQDSFKSWYRDRAKIVAAASGERKGLLQRIFKSDNVDSYLDKCVYKDRVLWADIEVNGKVVCSGAFSRWVAYDDVNSAIRAKTDKG